MGIGMIIVMQALLHMYISVGDFVTGQPLPLMSQGGTSVLINCIYIGFLLSISQYANKTEEKKKAIQGKTLHL
jgi:cell division protein FtsW